MMYSIITRLLFSTYTSTSATHLFYNGAYCHRPLALRNLGGWRADMRHEVKAPPLRSAHRHTTLRTEAKCSRKEQRVAYTRFSCRGALATDDIELWKPWNLERDPSRGTVPSYLHYWKCQGLSTLGIVAHARVPRSVLVSHR